MSAYCRSHHRHADPWQPSGLQTFSSSLPALQELPAQLRHLLDDLSGMAEACTPTGSHSPDAASAADMASSAVQQALLFDGLVDDLSLDFETVVRPPVPDAEADSLPYCHTTILPYSWCSLPACLQEKVADSLVLDMDAALLDSYVLYWQLRPFLHPEAVQLLFSLAGQLDTEAQALLAELVPP